MCKLQHVDDLSIRPFSRFELIVLFERFTARESAPSAIRLMQVFFEIATFRLFNGRETVSPSKIWSLWYGVVTFFGKLTTPQKLHGQITLPLYEGD